MPGPFYAAASCLWNSLPAQPRSQGFFPFPLFSLGKKPWEQGWWLIVKSRKVEENKRESTNIDFEADTFIIFNFGYTFYFFLPQRRVHTQKFSEVKLCLAGLVYGWAIATYTTLCQKRGTKN